MRADAIVCFAGNDWWAHNPMTEKQWMRVLAADGYTVLFVNSIGIGLPGKDSPRIASRLWRKLKSLARWLRKDDGVWVLTPFLIPLWSIPAIRRFNLLLITLQVRFAMKRAGMTRAVFWAGLPTAALLVDRIPHASCVYYVQDNYTAYYDAMNFTRVAEDHRSLLERADVVICASIGLAERESATASRVEYIPHGVHPVFLEADIAARPPIPEELRALPRPIIGYWGSLEALQDTERTAQLARMHPGWSFVFIGRVMMDNSALAALPNVHFLGYLPIEDIPRYGMHFDIGYLSFVQSEWITYSCPIKFREYLALGLPVVSPPIIEVERAFPSEGCIARSTEEFSICMENAFRGDSDDRRAQRRALVQEYSWEASARNVATVLASLEGSD
ncbi:glycosyltransferase [bacterium]|nr:glycosyltransferase [bacterium]